jgi:hypothetical protein
MAAAANKIVALLVLMITCCSFYKASAVNPEHCALKDQVLNLCREYLRVVPVPGPIHPPTPPAKDSRCCKKVREVTQWKELMDCLTHDEERDHWMWWMRALPGVCKIDESSNSPPPPKFAKSTRVVARLHLQSMSDALFVIRRNNLLLLVMILRRVLLPCTAI